MIIVVLWEGDTMGHNLMPQLSPMTSYRLSLESGYALLVFHPTDHDRSCLFPEPSFPDNRYGKETISNCRTYGRNVFGHRILMYIGSRPRHRDATEREEIELSGTELADKIYPPISWIQIASPI